MEWSLTVKFRMVWAPALSCKKTTFFPNADAHCFEVELVNARFTHLEMRWWRWWIDPPRITDDAIGRLTLKGRGHPSSRSIKSTDQSKRHILESRLEKVKNNIDGLWGLLQPVAVYGWGLFPLPTANSFSTNQVKHWWKPLITYFHNYFVQ